MDALKIVVEELSKSARRYHVSSPFDCALQQELRTASLERHLIDANPQTREEVLDIVVSFVSENSPACSLEMALRNIEGCRHTHSESTGIIDVVINLAVVDWSTVHRRVIDIIKSQHAWRGIVELTTV